MNHRLHCTCKLAQHMSQFLPTPGLDYKKIILVDLQPGESVKNHRHPEEHVVLHYLEDSTEPLLVYPKAGMLVYIPPDTLHGVPEAKQHRQSIAMVWNALPQD